MEAEKLKFPPLHIMMQEIECALWMHVVVMLNVFFVLSPVSPYGCYGYHRSVVARMAASSSHETVVYSAGSPSVLLGHDSRESDEDLGWSSHFEEASADSSQQVVPLWAEVVTLNLVRRTQTRANSEYRSLLVDHCSCLSIPKC